MDIFEQRENVNIGINRLSKEINIQLKKFSSYFITEPRIK